MLAQIQESVTNRAPMPMFQFTSMNTYIIMASILSNNTKKWQEHVWWDIRVKLVDKSGTGSIKNFKQPTQAYWTYTSLAITRKSTYLKKDINILKVEERLIWQISLIATIMSASTISSINLPFMNISTSTLFILNSAVIWWLINTLLEKIKAIGFTLFSSRKI